MKTYFYLALLLGSIIATSAEADNSLKEFMTDGCTMFIDGTPSKPDLWKHCCVEHDMRYWFGGDQSDMDKTDLRLKACVKEVAGGTWASLIYAGVRTGHHSPVKNKTQWGWGWKLSRKKIPLIPAEIDYVVEEVRRLPYDSELLEKFIDQNFDLPNADL